MAKRILLEYNDTVNLIKIEKATQIISTKFILAYNDLSSNYFCEYFENLVELKQFQASKNIIDTNCILFACINYEHENGNLYEDNYEVYFNNATELEVSIPDTINLRLGGRLLQLYYITESITIKDHRIEETGEKEVFRQLFSLEIERIIEDENLDEKDNESLLDTKFSDDYYDLIPNFKNLYKECLFIKITLNNYWHEINNKKKLEARLMSEKNKINVNPGDYQINF